MCENPLPNRRATRMDSIVNGSLFLCAITLGLAVYLTPLNAWLGQSELINAHLALFGLAAPLVFTAAAALLTTIGVPRLLLYSLGGMAFGFAWGLVWTQIGTLLGSYAIFMFVRWRGRDCILGHFPRLRSFSQSLESRGLMAVVLIRQLPLNGFYNTVFLGLTPVSHGDFLLGSLLGFLPLGVTACLLGAGLIQGDWLKGVRYIALGLACSVIAGIALNRVAQARKTA